MFFFPGPRRGHQDQRPRRTVMAGTNVVRTTKVSRSTPKVTAKPICLSPKRLPAVMLAKVPAMIMPAEVMMPPVRAKARRVP